MYIASGKSLQRSLYTHAAVEVVHFIEGSIENFTLCVN